MSTLKLCIDCKFYDDSMVRDKALAKYDAHCLHTAAQVQNPVTGEPESSDCLHMRIWKCEKDAKYFEAKVKEEAV